MPGRASLGGNEGESFLAGLTAHDVLHNRGVPRGLRAAWVGALRQLLPEAAAAAVADQYPTFRRLYDHLRRTGEIGLQDVRVGSKRLGPARSRRIHRVLLAAREQAEESVDG